MSSHTSHYISVGGREKAWGLYVTGVGHAVIDPYGVYPPAPHPAGYDFQWKRGRILEEFALLHLVHGSGIFESAHQIRLKIQAGDCILLFPGEWHRYKPEKTAGWEEYWLTFQGDWARAWRKVELIRPEAPRISSERDHSLAPLFEEMLQLTESKSNRRFVEVAALCHLVIARSLHNAETSIRTGSNEARIHEAGDYLRLHPEKDVDLPQLARQHGMSYSSFRRNFTKYYGISPDRFHQEARVARVKQFLIETALPLKEIAERLHYSNEFYMMQVFKRHTGLTTTQWRRR